MNHTNNPRSLILIPAYNEAARIGSVIESIRRVVPETPVLLINDGSKDDTASISDFLIRL